MVGQNLLPVFARIPRRAHLYWEHEGQAVRKGNTSWSQCIYGVYDMERTGELKELSKSMPANEELRLFGTGQRVGALPWNEVMVTRKKKIRSKAWANVS